MEGSEKVRKTGLEGVHAGRKGRTWGGPAAGRKGMKNGQARKREEWGMVMQGGAEEWRVGRQRERNVCWRGGSGKQGTNKQQSGREK